MACRWKPLGCLPPQDGLWPRTVASCRLPDSPTLRLKLRWWRPGRCTDSYLDWRRRWCLTMLSEHARGMAPEAACCVFYLTRNGPSTCGRMGHFPSFHVGCGSVACEGKKTFCCAAAALARSLAHFRRARSFAHYAALVARVRAVRVDLRCASCRWWRRWWRQRCPTAYLYTQSAIRAVLIVAVMAHHALRRITATHSAGPLVPPLTIGSATFARCLRPSHQLPS